MPGIGLYQAVKMYAEHVGEHGDPLAYRVISSTERGSKHRDHVEMEFGSGGAIYTRVAEFVFIQNRNRVIFNSALSKTRLHVPADKLITGMKFQRDGEWYLAKSEGGESIVGFQEGNPPGSVVLFPWDSIEITCYYVSGEGSYVGEVLIADPEETKFIARLKGVGLGDLINGCKFDMLEALVDYERLKRSKQYARIT